MKVSALIAAALLVVSFSAQADHHEGKKEATKPATQAATADASAHHEDCSKLKGKAKKACETHEKASHTETETHTH